MLDQLGRYLTPQVRQHLYVIITAAVPLLIIRGILDAEEAALWLALAAAVLGTGTAAVAVSAQRKRGILPPSKNEDDQ